MVLTFILCMLVIIALWYTDEERKYTNHDFNPQEVINFVDKTINKKDELWRKMDADASRVENMYFRKLPQYWKQHPQKQRLTRKNDFKKYAIINKRY